MVSALDSGASAPGSSLAGDIVLCSQARQFTLTVPWVPANCLENLTICGGVTCDGLASRPGEVEILPATSCYRNRDKLRHQCALRPLRLRFLEDTISSLIYRGARKTVCNVTGVSELWKKAVGEVLARHKVFMPVGLFETPTSTMSMPPPIPSGHAKFLKLVAVFCV